MARPVCRVLIPESLEQAFLLIASQLNARGFSLTNPETTKVTTWTNDGVQMEISPSDVMRQVVSGVMNNVQFWKAASDDVFVAWEAAHDRCTFTIYLDGLDSVAAVALVSQFVELALTKFRRGYGEDTAITVEFE